MRRFGRILGRGGGRASFAMPCRASGGRVAVAVIALALIALLRPAVAEVRCGWLENPTPGNWWLKDPHGLWIISAQGGPYAEGVEKLPEPAPGRFVATNGHYGYMCACVSGAFDAQAKTVTRIDSAHASPLSACRADKAVPAP